MKFAVENSFFKGRAISFFIVWVFLPIFFEFKVRSIAK